MDRYLDATPVVNWDYSTDAFLIGIMCYIGHMDGKAKRKLTILVDMDDTIEQLLKAWLKCLNEKYGRDVKCDDILCWDITKAYPGLTKDQVYGEINLPGFWGKVEPVPGAAEALKRFMDSGHRVFIVTATPYQSVTEKMTDLLFRYFPFLSWQDVIITSCKQLVHGDVLIDDGVHNLENGDYEKILITAPYNKDYDAEANGMYRVSTWSEIVSIIDRLASQSTADH